MIWCVQIGHRFYSAITVAKYRMIMTSSNGNIFRVTGPLWGEFPSQRPVTWSFDVFFDLRLNKWLKVDGDLRRHHVQYDVAVIWSTYKYLSM